MYSPLPSRKRVPASGQSRVTGMTRRPLGQHTKVTWLTRAFSQAREGLRDGDFVEARDSGAWDPASAAGRRHDTSRFQDILAARDSARPDEALVMNANEMFCGDRLFSRTLVHLIGSGPSEFQLLERSQVHIHACPPKWAKMRSHVPSFLRGLYKHASALGTIHRSYKTPI